MKNTFTFLFAFLFALTVNSQGLDFDGNDDYVRLPGHPSVMNGTAFTFETWIKPRQSGSEILSIATKGSGYPFFLYIESMGMGMPGMEDMPVEYILMCDLWNTGYGLHRAAYSIDGSFFNNWHHIAATYNGSSWILYVDGIAVSSVPVSGTIANLPAEPLFLGVYQGMWNFAGAMDEVRVWNVARSQAQIFADMKKQLAPNTPGLVSYYTFNQGAINGNNGAITGLTDVSPTANHASLHNFSLTGNASNFVAGNPQLTVLPVHLSSFTAREENKSVILNWQTASENFSSFTIERSAEGQNFTAIGKVTAEATNRYEFTDRQPLPGTNIYRLSGTQSNGRKEYSKAIVVKRGAVTALRIYPNPAGNHLQLQFSYKGTGKIFIRDLTGNSVITIDLPSSSALSPVTLPVDISSLPQGSYVAEVLGKSVKFVKQ